MATGSNAELVELVTQMKGTIEQHFLPTLQELQNKVDSEVGRVHDWQRDLLGAVNAAKPGLHDAFQASVAKINEMEAAVKQELDGSVQAINTFVGHIHDSKSGAHELLNTALSHTADVHDKLSHADEMHGTIGDAIAHALGDLGSNAGEHLVTLETHHQQIVVALHAYGDNANTHVTDLVSKLHATGEAVTEHVSTAVQLHTSNISEVVGQQKDHLVGNIGEQLGGHVGDLIGHVQGFVQTGESLGHVFDGGLGDVLQKVDEVSGLIDSIKPVIELAKKLS